MNEKFFTEYFIDKKSNKGSKKLLDNLYKIPKKDKGLNIPHFQKIKKDLIHQADLLIMPNDSGYKYILVVVDNGTRITDAQALKQKTPEAVLDGFKNIYERKILKYPKKIQIDAGTEFKGILKNYFSDNGISIRVAKIGRHRQQALVERKNQTIARALFKRMHAEELLTDEPSKKWVKFLPYLIRALNKKTKKKLKIKKIISDDPVCEGDSCKLLEQGTHVRVMLDKPISVAKGSKLYGSFRSTDIRWDPKIRIIKEIILKPNMPPMYLLNGKDGGLESVGYTKNQLQVVPDNEEYPSGKLISNIKKVKKFVVEKILDSKKINGKKHYLVKWAGFPSNENTWELATNMGIDVPEIVDEYENRKQSQFGDGFTYQDRELYLPILHDRNRVSLLFH